MGEVVHLSHTKYDGSLHWHFDLVRMGEDEHGVWLGAPVGTVLQRGHEPSRPEVNGFVCLVPHEGSWDAYWNRPGEHDVELYIDVTSRPAWEGDAVTMIDLDLDVIRRFDGTVFVDDEDEFAEHQVRWSYPPEVVAKAEATCAWLVDAVTSRAEPFGEVGASWLSRLS